MTNLYPIYWHQTSMALRPERDYEPTRDRESYVYITERGAVEGWRTKEIGSQVHPSGYYGGIEIHSKAPLFEGQDPHPGLCQWTNGTCYHTGSSLSFEQIELSFDDPDHLFSVLQEWGHIYFGKDNRP